MWKTQKHAHVENAPINPRGSIHVENAHNLCVENTNGGSWCGFCVPDYSPTTAQRTATPRYWDSRRAFQRASAPDSERTDSVTFTRALAQHPSNERPRHATMTAQFWAPRPTAF